MAYIKRIIDKTIADKLQIMGCVVVRGSKWCGKTTTSEQFAKSIIELQDPVEGVKCKKGIHSPIPTHAKPGVAFG